MAAVTAMSPAMSCMASDLRVPRVDSGAWTYVNYLPGSVHWVDDDRVLFLGASDEQLAKRRIPPTDLVLKLFHVSSGTIDVVERGVFGVCVADGSLLLYFKKAGQVQYEVRALGAAPGRRFEIDEAVVLDPLNCRVYGASSAPGVQHGRHWKPLRSGDGVLDFGERSGRSGVPPVAKLQHRSAEGKVLATLDLTNQDVDQLAYVPFRKEYFLYKILGGGGARALDSDHCVVPGHWFSPGKPVRHVEIAISCPIMNGPGIAVFPTRAGYLVRLTGGAPGSGGSDTEGLHLTGGERSGRVMGGFVGPVAVSPNGCKVAAVHADSIRAKRDLQSTLEILDLCAPEEKS
jgi:hypothetical protein